MQRRFVADGPDLLWCTDITEHPTAEGKLDCAAVLDVFTRQVVGWSIADHMRAELVVDALQMATWRRRPAAGAIVHSDRGRPSRQRWPALARRTNARPPPSTISATRPVPSSARRPAATTAAPSAATRSATARPIPDVAPDDHHDLRTQPRAEASHRVRHGHTPSAAAARQRRNIEQAHGGSTESPVGTRRRSLRDSATHGMCGCSAARMTDPVPGELRRSWVRTAGHR